MTEVNTDQEVMERYALAVSRIRELVKRPEVPARYASWIMAVADFLIGIDHIHTESEDVGLANRSLAECESDQEMLYALMKPEAYETHYLSPAYSVSQLGGQLGGILSCVFADMMALIPWAYEGRWDLVTLFMEFFLMIQGCFRVEDKEDLPQAVKDTVYWFYHDNSEIFTADQVMDLIDPSRDFFTDIVMHADLADPGYLYRYGTWIGDNERKLAAYLNSMPDEEIHKIADTYTEGYRKGFEVTGKDITKKSTVKVEFPIGAERVARAAVINFAELGLKPVMVRESVLSMMNRGMNKRGVYGSSLNRQFDYDHKNDRGYYLDGGLVERRLEVMRDVFSKHAALARGMGGPAVIDVFGEPDFTPVNHPENYHFTPKQREWNVTYASRAGAITNEYIHGEERSFTIIAFPLPSIGPKFPEIFRRTMEINTLDYEKYQQMQQRIIDVLDQGSRVRVVGRGGNHTDVTVRLHHVDDPIHQTKFENCVADVNIPVGEVFTSPVLEGTNGVLYVSHVYLEGTEFRDLSLVFRDGMVKEYRCSNFPTDEENRRLIEDNILFHHKSLPLGEFAIGTNTTAYRMARDYGIEAKLPILIMEKTGPHFAVGDTCYSHEEDNRVFNPDGKEIIAKENSISAKRRENPLKAYFNCHTDITIPFEELGSITVICDDGRRIDVIRNGRFVVPGTEELNIPLDR